MDPRAVIYATNKKGFLYGSLVSTAMISALDEQGKVSLQVVEEVLGCFCIRQDVEGCVILAAEEDFARKVVNAIPGFVGKYEIVDESQLI